MPQVYRLLSPSGLFPDFFVALCPEEVSHPLCNRQHMSSQEATKKCRAKVNEEVKKKMEGKEKCFKVRHWQNTYVDSPIMAGYEKIFAADKVDFWMQVQGRPVQQGAHKRRRRRRR